MRTNLTQRFHRTEINYGLRRLTKEELFTLGLAFMALSIIRSGNGTAM